MKAHCLGHVVFYVKDLERSLTFYRNLLGFQEVGRIFNGMAAALTPGRTHHELLLIQGLAPARVSGFKSRQECRGPLGKTMRDGTDGQAHARRAVQQRS